MVENREDLEQHIAVNQNLLRDDIKAKRENEIEFITEQQAIKVFFQSYRKDICRQLDLTDFMESFRIKIQSLLMTKIIKLGAFKVHISAPGSCWKVSTRLDRFEFVDAAFLTVC